MVQYDSLLAIRKTNRKIIMSEEDFSPTFGFYILIDPNPNTGVPIGCIHDFLVNRQRPGSQESLMRVILCLEFTGFQSKCSEVRVYSSIVEDFIMEDLEFDKVKRANGEVYWVKD